MGASTLTDTNAITCPKCDGQMWDNRTTKKNVKAPDYKCKNRACDGAIWPDKKVTPIKSAGGGLATGSPGAPSVEPTTEKPKLTKLYLEATEFVLDKIVPLYIDAEVGINSADIAACVQTVFIAASKER